MFTEIFYYNCTNGRNEQQHFLIASDCLAEICSVYEGNFTNRIVTHIRLRNGQLFERIGISGWDRIN